jgi:hypothetical protein
MITWGRVVIVEIVVASRGDQSLPTKPGQIRGFMESIRSETPLPDWLLDTTEMLSEVDDFTAFECAVREWHLLLTCILLLS